MQQQVINYFNLGLGGFLAKGKSFINSLFRQDVAKDEVKYEGKCDLIITTSIINQKSIEGLCKTLLFDKQFRWGLEDRVVDGVNILAIKTSSNTVKSIQFSKGIYQATVTINNFTDVDTIAGDTFMLNDTFLNEYKKSLLKQYDATKSTVKEHSLGEYTREECRALFNDVYLLLKKYSADEKNIATGSISVTSKKLKYVSTDIKSLDSSRHLDEYNHSALLNYSICNSQINLELEITNEKDKLFPKVVYRKSLILNKDSKEHICPLKEDDDVWAFNHLMDKKDSILDTFKERFALCID